MSQSFRFRHASELAGAFVIFSVVLIFVGILLIGRAQQWFEPIQIYRITFPEEGTFGIQKGAGVYLLGTPIGQVDRIIVDDDGALHALLRVRGQFVRFIRDDSVAVVKKQFGIAGDSYIEITAGRGAPLTEDEAVLPVRKDTEITEMIERIAAQVESALVPLLKEIENTLAEYRGLAADLRNPEGELLRAMAATRSILEAVERGEGSVGHVLKDPTIAREAEGILSNVRQLTERLEEARQKMDAILENIRRASDALPETADVVRGEARDAPGLVLQAQAALREAEALLAGLQKHWLLRAYMNRPPDIEALPVPAPAHRRSAP